MDKLYFSSPTLPHRDFLLSSNWPLHLTLPKPLLPFKETCPTCSNSSTLTGFSTSSHLPLPVETHSANWVLKTSPPCGHSYHLQLACHYLFTASAPPHLQVHALMSPCLKASMTEKEGKRKNRLWTETVSCSTKYCVIQPPVRNTSAYLH